MPVAFTPFLASRRSRSPLRCRLSSSSQTSQPALSLKVWEQTVGLAPTVRSPSAAAGAAALGAELRRQGGGVATLLDPRSNVSKGSPS